jgi:hypothetical protein
VTDRGRGRNIQGKARPAGGPRTPTVTVGRRPACRRERTPRQAWARTAAATADSSSSWAVTDRGRNIRGNRAADSDRERPTGAAARTPGESPGRPGPESDFRMPDHPAAVNTRRFGRGAVGCGQGYAPYRATRPERVADYNVTFLTNRGK